MPPAEDGEPLRPVPSTGDAAAEEQLNVANSIYSRKMAEYAIIYEKFLITYPSANGRDVAMFRLAESHRMLGNEEAARSGIAKSSSGNFNMADLQEQVLIGWASISTRKRARPRGQSAPGGSC